MPAPTSKSAKSAAKAPPTRSEPRASITHPGRERRPSDKVAAQRKFVLYYLSSAFLKILIGLEQQEAELLKAQKAERRALREKKALQKAHQRANLPSDGEGEYEPRENPMVGFF
jgi:hypothetical protein